MGFQPMMNGTHRLEADATRESAKSAGISPSAGYARRMVRIAMLSLAHMHAKEHIQQLRATEGAQIAAVWDDKPARGQAAAKELNVPFDDDLARVLARKDVDAVVVNTETCKHRTVLIAAAHAKKHIFTEKPVTITAAEADEVAREVKASGVKFMISLPERSRPTALYMKQLIDDGTLGRITLARFRVSHAAALENWFKDDAAWFVDEKQSGGGAMFDIGCHTLDLMRWMLGEPASVTCKKANVTGAYAVDDNVVAIVEFKNKALGILDASYTQRCGPNFLELHGTEGCAVRGMPGPLVSYMTTKGSDGTSWLKPPKLPKSRPAPMDQWLAAIERNEPPHLTVDDARNLTHLLEAAYRSAREGREVKL
jgi:predicted dehydrogenase